MALSIKDVNTNNHAIVDSDGNLHVAVTGGSGSNASVGTNGVASPSSSTQIGAVDPNGNLAPLQVDSDGQLKIAGISVFVSQDVRVLFNEVNGVAVGIETAINTYTAPSGKIAYLLTIETSGENRAQYNVYLQGTLLDKKYSNVTVLSANFDYKTGSGSVPGLVIPVGQVVDVKVINSGGSTANYNSRFLILEVTV